jgi:hypothetical protein
MTSTSGLPTRTNVWIAVALVFLAFASATFGQQSPPDLILFNGKLFTSNSAQPYAEALAIRGDRITAVGNSKDIEVLAGPQTTHSFSRRDATKRGATQISNYMAASFAP